MNNDKPQDIKDITGVKLDLKALPETERVWSGQLADMETRATKNEKATPYWIFKSHEDENGMQFNFTTFSITQKVILEDALTNMRPLKIVYQLPQRYGSFTVVCVELPDGTFSAKEARDSWKKGNKANNRALVLQSAVLLVTWQKFDSGIDAIGATLGYAEQLLKWVEKEAV